MRIRHAMRLGLGGVLAGWADAPGPPGVSFEGVGREPAELADAFLSAYPPSHLDAVPGWLYERLGFRIVATLSKL